jgi:hypothetical protein
VYERAPLVVQIPILDIRELYQVFCCISALHKLAQDDVERCVYGHAGCVTTSSSVALKGNSIGDSQERTHKHVLSEVAPKMCSRTNPLCVIESIEIRGVSHFADVIMYNVLHNLLY